MYRYKIYMNNGKTFKISNDEPLDLEAIAKARWMEIQIPHPKGKLKKAYLNVAQIYRIEVTEEVSESEELMQPDAIGEMNKND